MKICFEKMEPENSIIHICSVHYLSVKLVRFYYFCIYDCIYADSFFILYVVTNLNICRV